jgi:hypothetical protein
LGIDYESGLCVPNHDMHETDDLTPAIKVKRKEVFKKYGKLMDRLYEE